MTILIDDIKSEIRDINKKLENIIYDKGILDGKRLTLQDELRYLECLLSVNLLGLEEEKDD
jgi:hypothetical protein